jgi:DNA-binding CsgD family transcriptional regulator
MTPSSQKMTDPQKLQETSMRTWTGNSHTAPPQATGGVLAGMIYALGQPSFESAVLDNLHPAVPAASWSVYRTGGSYRPTLFMSSSRGVTDTTRDCWRAYLSGPYLRDRTLVARAATEAVEVMQLCHITAQEVPQEHRSKVYEAHGVAERVSIVSLPGDGSVFAINFYRHQHQKPFSDAQLSTFGDIAPALQALTRKHLALLGMPAMECDGLRATAGLDSRSRLLALAPTLTVREMDVCQRLLQGMTQDGIASDLGLSLPTVKTYRNRAFNRLGIHFRNELYALVTGPALNRA